MSPLVPLLLGALLLPVQSPEPRPEDAPQPRPQAPNSPAGPFEHRLIGNPQELLQAGPEGWCPVGEEVFGTWLEQRRRLGPGTSRAKAANVEWVDRVVVIEDDGSMLRYDRHPDLEGLTLEFIPDGDGYTVISQPVRPEVDVGPELFADVRDWREEPIDMGGFLFPFGDTAYGSLWAATTFTLAFADPEPPGPAQLHLHEQLPDRTPRIAPWQQGTSLAGRNLHYVQHPDRAVFTWRAVEGGWLDVEIQAVLYADGSIDMHFVRLTGLNHGGPAVVDGNAAWWMDRTPGGETTSPPDEVPVPAPDGPAIDIVAIRAFQIADSELLEIEVEFQEPLPAMTDGRLQFVFEIRDEPGGPLGAQLWAEWEDGGWNWTSYSPEIVGNSIRFQVSKSQLGLTDDEFEVLAWAAQDWTYHQAVAGMFSFPLTPPQPLLRDFSEAVGETMNGPLFEPFTLPELVIDPIYRAFLDEFENPQIDGFAVFQNFLTDIVFYAGAWSTVGNAGADGIGTGNSADPVTPALLHMNALGYGWNSWDAGKITVLNHEFGHHWLYFPSVDEDGVVGQPLGGGHPAGWVHTPAATPVFNDFDASCMGGSTWTDNGDGTFTSAPSFASYGYSWHDLYLMGLARPDEVEDWFYLQDSDPGLPGAYWPAENLTVTATRVDVNVGQFETAMGPRVPARGESQTDFIVPMVLLARPGEWSQPDVDELVRTCEIWSEAFEGATLERATLACDRVGNRPPVPEILEPAPGVRVPVGTTLQFFGTATDPDRDAVELTWNFGPFAPITGGEGPHEVTFTELGLHVVQLDAVDEVGLNAVWPDVRVIEVTCADPTEVLGQLMVARPEPGTLAFEWTLPSETVDDAVLLEAGDPQGPFEPVAAGAPGLTAPERQGLRFFQVASRNLPDCIGPW